MSRVHVRCRKCDARRVFSKHPDDYVRPARCACGYRSWRADKWMNGRDTSIRGMGCSCRGYPYVHRRGSPYCWYRADGSDRMPGDPDFIDIEENNG